MRFLKIMVFLLYLMFAIITIGGIYLTIESVHRYEAQQPSVLEGRYKEGEVSIKLETAIPGIVLIVIGSVGLLAILIKIPVRKILGYQVPAPREGTFEMMFVTKPQPILSAGIERVPLLLWWLFYSKGRAIRVEREEP